MKKEIQLFNQYAKKYDLRNKNIMRKYHHSFRVMEFCKEIAVSLHLSEKDISIAALCGLLHDIARFKQWTCYETYRDTDSFDHGDERAHILNENNFINEFTNDAEIASIVMNSVQYHNKLELPEMNDRTLLFIKIVRDADKLDIMTEQENQIGEKEIILKENLLFAIYRNKLCKNEEVSNDTDSILRMLSWINDFNFKYSYSYLKEKNIIQKKIDLLEIYGQTEETKKLKNFLLKKIEERINTI